MMAGAHHFIDAQGENRSLLVALDGRIKLTLLVLALGVNLTAGGLRVPCLLALLSLILVLVAGERAAAFFRRMAVPAMMAVVALLTQLFWYRQGEALLAFDLFSWTIVLYRGGLWHGLEIGSRIVGGMGTLLFFALTTPLPELMRAARFFRFPPVLVELALIMYRYIFLLLEEGGRIRNAQRARLGYVGFRNGLRSSGILGGMLVLRTYDRAERSFEAMRCRGYRGVLTAVEPGQVQKRDWVVLILGIALLALLFTFR